LDLLREQARAGADGVGVDGLVLEAKRDVEDGDVAAAALHVVFALLVFLVLVFVLAKGDAVRSKQGVSAGGANEHTGLQEAAAAAEPLTDFDELFTQLFKLLLWIHRFLRNSGQVWVCRYSRSRTSCLRLTAAAPRAARNQGRTKGIEPGVGARCLRTVRLFRGGAARKLL